jgi:hypothetical protein
MAMDPDLVAQLNNSHARGIAASAGVQEVNGNAMGQLGLLIASSNHFDGRLMNGFLADQLFNQQLVEAKSAYNTPYTPGAAPLPATPSK